jgi:hypothetical protein
MTHNNHDAHTTKISPEFSARLARLKPRQKVRAIVMLRINVPGQTLASRQARAEWQAVIERIRQSSELALSEIDDILAHHCGKRLAAHVNALGAVPVETTTTGIHALAASDQVKAILEDQGVSLLSAPRFP